MSTQLYLLASQNWWAADGTTELWNINFAGGYIDKSHVQAYYREADVVTPVVLTEANFLGPNQIKVTPPVPAGATFVIRRVTPKIVPLVDFTDRANLSEASLDTNARQAIFAVAEAMDVVTMASLEATSLDLDVIASAAQAAVAPAIQTLRDDLADATTAAKGAGMVGFDKDIPYPADTVGAAIRDLYQNVGGGGEGSIVVADVAALRLVQGALRKQVFTQYYAASRPHGKGGAEYICDITDNSSTDNGGTVIVGLDGSVWKLQVRDGVLPARQCGVVGDGIVGDTDRLLAACQIAYAEKYSVLIEGTPLLNTQLVLDFPARLIFAGWPNHANGTSGPEAAVLPGSWLRIDPSMPLSQSGVVVAHPGIHFTGGGIGCGVGTWLYDGLLVQANSFLWDGAPVIFGVGRDAYRIGTDVGGGSYNSNSVRFVHPRAAWVGRNGFNISDDDGSRDANAFEIVQPHILNCAGHGIRFGKTFLGGRVTAPTIENCGVGLYFEPDASQITVDGGNIEANNGQFPGAGPVKNVIFAGSAVYRNFLENVAIQGRTVSTPSAISQTVWEDVLGNTAYTPTIYGDTSAGTTIYNRQEASYTVSHGVLHLNIRLAWGGGHSGTGQAYISLPQLLPGINIDTAWGGGSPEYFPVTVLSASGFGIVGVPAGLSVVGLVRNNSIPQAIQLYIVNPSGSGLASLPIWGSGDIIIQATIPLLPY